MLEVQVDLDFACCTCGNAMGVTLKCQGKGLAAGKKAVAAVQIPCPSCQAINLLYFSPNGKIHAVAPCCSPRPIPEPSLN